MKEVIYQLSNLNTTEKIGITIIVLVLIVLWFDALLDKNNNY